MRKREIQSFSLKLSDLKEYELVRQERYNARNPNKDSEGTSSEDTSTIIVKVGPKSRQEIRERIGLASTD